jgi:hypothetical protein
MPFVISSPGRRRAVRQRRRSATLQMVVVAMITDLILLNYPKATGAETFDFNGSALIDCVCPSPKGTNNCAIRSSEIAKYTIPIFIRNGLKIDLSEACYRKRDEVACCDSPRDAYGGSVSRTCPGSSSC